MKSPFPNERPKRHPAPSSEDEELETGEPIPEEEKPGANGPKIPARRPFTRNPQSTGASAETPAPAGQMVLSTAKYLPKSAFEPDPHRRKKRTKGETDSGQSFEGKVFNSGAAGGLLAMGGATVWFVIGLMNDILFFYPPILFVIGLAAFLKGMTRSE
jgi:hypothetical protein